MNNANFIVDEIKGRVVSTRVNGLPEEIQIFYKACFKDFTHPDNSLQTSLFKIHLFENFESDKKEQTESYSGKTIKESAVNTKKLDTQKCSDSNSFLLSSEKSCIEVRTDSSGCLNWTEVYPYRPVNQSVWFRYERLFEGTGVHTGSLSVPMAVNPWLSLDPSGSAIQFQLVDLRFHPKSIDQEKTLISMKEADIPQCRLCSGKNDKNCKLCQYKKRSLSAVISHFDSRAARPRLWLNKVNTNISQEYVLIQKDHSKEHLNALKQFKVCHGDEKENCDPPGRFFRVSLNMPLRIQVKNYINELEVLSLNRGSYSIKAYLFLKNEEGKHIILHRDMGFKTASLTVGTKERDLTSEFYFHVPYEHYGLSAFLGLKVQAEGDYKDLFLPFEGVFPFPGKLQSVLGARSLDLESTIKTLYEKENLQKNLNIIHGYRLSGSWLNTEKEGFRKAGWDVRLNRLRFSDISVEKNECPTPVDHTVRYVGEVCIVDPLTNNSVPNTHIAIKRQNIFFSRDGQSREGEVADIPEVRESEDWDISNFKDGQWQGSDGQALKKLPYVTNTEGCLQWIDKIYHKWYNREHYFIRKMVFSKKEWGFEAERIIAINPWHWGFVFFQDITQLGSSSIRTADLAKGAEHPQIILHDFRSLSPEFIYTIDRWLGINIFQNLLFLFKIRIDRPDNIATGAGGQRPSAMDARRGYYFMRLILVKSHTEENGGQGNQVVHDGSFRKQYDKVQNWNTNIGWKVDRSGKEIGQMMNTKLEYITHFDTYVQVRDSVVNAYTNFLFDLDHFVFIGSNNRLIVQILPADPKYYVYHSDSCKVDPSRSSFVPFTDHELIARPFMGTFVPGDLRNWNTFRVLGGDTDLGVPAKDVMKLDIDSWQLDQFIKKGRKKSLEHKLFTQLKNTLLVNTGEWSEISTSTIKKTASVFEELYGDLVKLLKAPIHKSKISVFDERKDELIDSIKSTTTYADRALNGSNINDNKEREFLSKLNNVLKNALSFLESPDLSQTQLIKELEEMRKVILSLISEALSLPLSFSQKMKFLTHKENQNNKWFKPDISFPENPADWSKFNMNLFAKDEGLRVITMDDDELVDRFLNDLNSAARLHNKYHFSYRQNEKEQEGRSDGVTVEDQMIEERSKTSEELGFEYHKKLAEESLKEEEAFWNNFNFIDGDNYYAMDKKTKQMFLPDMRKSWLDMVVTEGIHSGTTETEPVMTFLHSLCGFWFDKFYQEYLEQEQLDTLYLKHMDHFKYYKGILEFFSKIIDNEQQYEDLDAARREELRVFAKDKHAKIVKGMEENNLLEMKNRPFLQVGNPFLVHDKRQKPVFLLDMIGEGLWSLFSSSEEKSGRDEEADDVDSGTVVRSIYEAKKDILKTATQMEAAMAVHGMPPVHSNSDYVLRAFRHPYFKCIANPFNFFHVEKKIIVGDIGSDYSDLVYEFGQTKNFNVQRAFDYAYSATWSMSRSFSTSLGTGFTFLGLSNGPKNLARFLNPLNLVAPVVSFGGFNLKSDWQTSKSDSDQNRRQQSLRFSDESLYLQVNHSAISIRLKRFRHCLVVRAKNLAFDGYKKDMVWRKDLEENFIYQIPYIKSGLLLCSEDINGDEIENPFRIEENYFYIFQPMSRGQFHNILSFRNRPFILSARGATEFEKLLFLAHAFVEADKVQGQEDYNPFGLFTNPYNTVSVPVDGLREFIQHAQVWDRTGFYPGVYDMRYDRQHYFFKNPDKRKKGAFERFGDWLYKKNPLGRMRIDNTEALPNREVNQ